MGKLERVDIERVEVAPCGICGETVQHLYYAGGMLTINTGLEGGALRFHACQKETP